MSWPGIRADEPAKARESLSRLEVGTNHSPAEQKELRAAILANVEQVINDAIRGSAILRHAVESGGVQMVGAYYELASGRVVFSEPASTATTAAK
jgi:carbonic anhydrase